MPVRSCVPAGRKSRPEKRFRQSNLRRTISAEPTPRFSRNVPEFSTLHLEFIPLRIRPATSADISTIVALERACETAAHWTDQQYLQLFQATPDAPQRIFLIAETCSIVMAE